MKKIRARSTAFSVLLAAPLLMVSATRARADVDFGANVSLGFHAGEADVNVFYDQLAPYGDWVDTGRYGLCWAPRVSEQDWRPYYYGHWVYTDYGWTWVSDEEWGWGPYHYGRWAFDPAYGWVWVPGSVWAPAWVAWRYGDGYAGWAPLPPDVDPSAGPADWRIDPLSFVFVQDRYVAEPVLVDRYVPPARNVTIVNVTRNVTNYTVVNNQVVNQGVPVQQVERATGRAVPRVRVAEQTAPAPTRVRGDEVAIYKPAVPKASATTRPRTATPQRPPATTEHPTSPTTTTQRPPATPQHPTGPTTATQRPPAVAPPPTADPAELQRRHAQEQRALQAKEAQEREKLRQIHEQEKAAPPPNVSQQQLEKQHQDEQRAQAEHEQREKQAQQQRQARERQAAQQAQHQGQGQKQGQSEKQKNEKDKKKPENQQQ